MAAVIPSSYSASHQIARVSTQWRPDNVSECPYDIATCTGCTGCEQDRLDDDKIRKDRLEFFETLMKTNAIQTISSPASQREQLFVNFINNLGWIQDISARYALLHKLRDWFEPGTVVMTGASDCLLLKHFAYVTNSTRFWVEASRRHKIASQRLEAELQRPDAVNDDSVLAAIDALGMCNLYHGSPKQEHISGACNLLRLRGPERVMISTGMTKNLIFNTVQLSTIRAISERKAFMFGEPRWIRALEASCNGRVWCLFHLTCRVPAALEKVDSLDKMSEKQTGKLLNELVDLERRFQQWLLRWYEEFEEPPLRAIGVTNFVQFVAQYGSVVDAFPSALTFSSSAMALGHLIYWTTLLSLREAIFDIAIHPKSASLTTPTYHEFLASAVNECADSICRMVPYMFRDKPHVNGGERSTLGALLLAARWYEKTGVDAKAAYCHAVLNAQRKIWHHEYDGQNSIHWVDVDGFLLRRLLWQDVVGPSNCILCCRQPRATGEAVRGLRQT